MLSSHVKFTGSAGAKDILSDFQQNIKKFIKVIPSEYKKVMAVRAQSFAAKDAEV
jgi:glutamate synthase domain-containing protein 3